LFIKLGLMPFSCIRVGRWTFHWDCTIWQQAGRRRGSRRCKLCSVARMLYIWHKPCCGRGQTATDTVSDNKGRL